MATNYQLQYGFTPVGVPTGTPLPTKIVVADNSLQTNYANISLPGKNYLGYGVAVDQTLLNMTEHFASCSGAFNSGKGPKNPVMGQIWFDAGTNISGATTAGVLRYYTTNDGGAANAWNDILVAGSAINGNIGGTLFYKVTFNDLGTGNASGNVYDASAHKTVSWNTIGAAKGNVTGWATNLVASNANVVISGGLPGQFLTTNGSGVVSWSSTLPSPTTMTNITTGGAPIPGTITGQWSLTPGSKLSAPVGATIEANYADLAERHHADAEYDVGTVITVGGANEVTACQVSQTVLGVVSDQYAYLMNSEAGPDETHPAVGYLGRVPVKVIGPVTKHQRIAPAGNGLAMAADKNSFGWALETNNEVGEKLVLCLIK